MDKQNEIWKPVLGYEKLYEINESGVVKSLVKKGGRSTRPERLMVVHINHTGYPFVFLSKTGITKRALLHRLIAIHFIPNPKKYPHVNHKNGITTDFSIENLEWCTTKYNQLYRYRVLKKHSPLRKLTPQQVTYIRQNPNKSSAELGREFSISESSIRAIRTGKYYNDNRSLDLTL